MAEWLERYRGVFTLALLAALAVGGVLWWERLPPARPLAIATPTEQASERQRWITVDVGGAVAHPGIYTLSEGSRVADAIAAAGGETPDADLTRVNRALKLRDEQQLRVPRLPPGTPLAAQPTASGTSPAPAGPEREQPPGEPLDINAASLDQLDKLPGIGPVTAQRIVAYREQHGPFTNIAQLKEAKLVNSATYEKLKDLIVVQ